VQVCEDHLEVEFKFCSRAPERVTVDQIASLFHGKYGFIRWPSEVKLDIYLDTPRFDLYRLNSPLRLRRWGSAFETSGFACNFKYPPDIRQGLRRRELKTPLTDKESLEVCGGAIIGGSLIQAAEFVARSSSMEPVFAPRVLIFSYSSYYILRPCGDYELQAETWTGRSPMRGKANNLLALSFEQCAVQKAPEGGYERLIRNGMSDYDGGSALMEFSEAELEIRACPERRALAESLYARIFTDLKKKGLNMSTVSKYARAVEGINLL
jgi:hypothetical protein